VLLAKSSDLLDSLEVRKILFREHRLPAEDSRTESEVDEEISCRDERRENAK